MKTRISDQLLWDLYEFLKPTINVADVLFTPQTTYQLRNRIFTERGKMYSRYKERINKQNFSKLIYYLKRKNYITVKNLEGKKAVMITKKGINKALMSYFKKADTVLKKRADGKWIMIIFDIPRKYNKSRNLLRNVLQNLGYKLFLDSVWVTPYDVSEKTEQLLKFYSLDSYVKIFLIEKI